MQTTGYAPPTDPTAVFGRRVVAWLIDAVIGIVIVIIAFAALAESQDVGSSFRASEVCEIINNTDADSICIESGSTVILVEGGDFGTIILVALIYGVATQVVLPALTGGSVGKLMVGLRVVDMYTFARAGLGKHILRWILWVADGVICGPMIGGIVALSTKGHRRVGDLAASTFVVDRKYVDHPVAVAGANDTRAPGGAPPPFAPPATAPPPPFSPPATPAAAPPPMPPPAGPAATPPTPPVTPPPEPAATPPTPPVTPPPEPATTPPLPPATPPPEPAATPPAPPATPPPTAPIPEAPPATSPPAPEPVARPGVDAPQWDQARDTYIQWDPELEEWMEWNEAGGRWVPISR